MSLSKNRWAVVTHYVSEFVSPMECIFNTRREARDHMRWLKTEMSETVADVRMFQIKDLGVSSVMGKNQFVRIYEEKR